MVSKHPGLGSDLPIGSDQKRGDTVSGIRAPTQGVTGCRLDPRVLGLHNFLGSKQILGVFFDCFNFE